MQIKQWISDVTPYVVAHLKAGMPEAEAIEAGMADYTALLNEVCEGTSERVQAVKKALREATFAEFHLATV